MCACASAGVQSVGWVAHRATHRAAVAIVVACADPGASGPAPRHITWVIRSQGPLPVAKYADKLPQREAAGDFAGTCVCARAQHHADNNMLVLCQPAGHALWPWRHEQGMTQLFGQFRRFRLVNELWAEADQRPRLDRWR